MSKREKFSLMGTEDWLSYAFFITGVRLHRQEKWDDARRMYKKALERVRATEEHCLISAVWRSRCPVRGNST